MALREIPELRTARNENGLTLGAGLIIGLRLPRGAEARMAAADSLVCVGLDSARALVGRSDLLTHLDYRRGPR